MLFFPRRQITLADLPEETIGAMAISHHTMAGNSNGIPAPEIIASAPPSMAKLLPFGHNNAMLPLH